MSILVSEAEKTSIGTVQVYKTEDNLYNVGVLVESNFVVRHPNCDADSAIRALTHYLNNEAYQHAKLKTSGEL